MEVSKISPSPIRHPKLSAEQIARVQKTHQTLSEVYSVPLENVLEDFKRDFNPNPEIAIWEEIARAYTEYCSSNTLTLEEKKAVFEIFMLRSMADEQYVINNLKTKLFPMERVKQIMCGYHVPEQPLQGFKETPSNNNDNVILDKIQLEMPEEQLAAYIDTKEISTFIRTVEQKIREIFATNETEFYLILEFTVYPSEPHTVRMAIQNGLDNMVLQMLKTLKGELETLKSIHSKTDNIVFRAGFAIKAKI